MSAWNRDGCLLVACAGKIMCLGQSLLPPDNTNVAFVLAAFVLAAFVLVVCYVLILWEVLSKLLVACNSLSAKSNTYVAGLAWG